MKKPFLWLITVGLLLCCLFSVVDCTFFEHLVAADAECTKALLLKVEKALIADIPATILTQQHTRKQDAYGRYYWAE